MILAIPYNSALQKAYEKLTASMIRFGRHPAHTLFVVALPEHADEAFQFAMKFHDHFGRHFAVEVPAAGGPESPLQTSNRTFLAALAALRDYQPAEHENTEPVMLYFDPTWKPMKHHWFDEFQADYYLAGSPATFGHFKQEGPTGKVVGPVAISRRFLKMTKLVDFLSSDSHWREFLAWEIINAGLQAQALGRTSPAYIRPQDP